MEDYQVAAEKREKDQKEAEDKQGNDITSLNQYLNERNFRLNTLERDVERIKENIGEHDDDMLKITRTLQKQIDEKEAKISDYRTKTQALHQEEETRRNRIDTKFESEKSELMRKQKEEEEAQESKIEELQQ
jgi:hypothetical protein